MNFGDRVAVITLWSQNQAMHFGGYIPCFSLSLLKTLNDKQGGTIVITYLCQDTGSQVAQVPDNVAITLNIGMLD